MVVRLLFCLVVCQMIDYTHLPPIGYPGKSPEDNARAAVQVGTGESFSRGVQNHVDTNYSQRECFP